MSGHAHLSLVQGPSTVELGYGHRVEAFLMGLHTSVSRNAPGFLSAKKEVSARHQAGIGLAV